MDRLRIKHSYYYQLIEGEKANIAKTPADRTAEKRKTPTQPIATRPKNSHWTFFHPPTRPTPLTPPTMHCVDDTGMPRKDAVTTNKDAAKPADAPRDGERGQSLKPTAWNEEARKYVLVTLKGLARSGVLFPPLLIKITYST